MAQRSLKDKALKLIDNIEDAYSYSMRARQRANWRTPGTETARKENERADKWLDAADRKVQELRLFLATHLS